MTMTPDCCAAAANSDTSALTYSGPSVVQTRLKLLFAVRTGKKVLVKNGVRFCGAIGGGIGVAGNVGRFPGRIHAEHKLTGRSIDAGRNCERLRVKTR